MKTAILYHANCVDGFTAAWAVQRNVGGEVRPVNHGDPIPSDATKFDKVFIVDFSYPYNDLVQLGKSTDLIVLDHHASAMDDIWHKLQDPSSTPTMFTLDGLAPDHFRCVMDRSRSGAGIAWDHVTDGQDRPALVDYVEDRDLWNNKLPGTREVSAYLRCLEHDLELWDWLASVPIEDLIAKGDGCTTQLDAVIRAAVAQSYICEMGDRTFPIANVTYLAGSETAEALCEHWDAPMAGYYFRQGDGRWKYGFRSRDGSTTVHDFAAQFGGGGHPSASGALLDTLDHIQIPETTTPPQAEKGN